MYDWPDNKCVEILSYLKKALGPYLHILIDDIVLPVTNIPFEAVTVDLIMMTSLGSRERTVAEWNTLIDRAGLRTVRIDTYERRRLDSVIQVVPK